MTAWKIWGRPSWGERPAGLEAFVRCCGLSIQSASGLQVLEQLQDGEFLGLGFDLHG